MFFITIIGSGLAAYTLDLSVNKVFWYLTNCFYCLKSYLRTSLLAREFRKLNKESPLRIITGDDGSYLKTPKPQNRLMFKGQAPWGDKLSITFVITLVLGNVCHLKDFEANL